jgi:hypothetical protein
MTESEWVLVSNNERFWADEEVVAMLEAEVEKPQIIDWTDDYSNLFEIFE